jgi:hypothetical protein
VRRSTRAGDQYFSRSEPDNGSCGRREAEIKWILCTQALPSDLEALIWFDRNLVIGKGRNWFGERISQTKQKAHLLLSTLDMERDVIVSRQCYLSSYTFPAVYLAPALVQHVNSIESQGTKIKRQLFMESCLKTGELQNSAVLATGRRMLACLGDGMGCVRS